MIYFMVEKMWNQGEIFNSKMRKFHAINGKIKRLGEKLTLDDWRNDRQSNNRNLHYQQKAVSETFNGVE